jgi:hypothetical protein
MGDVVERKIARLHNITHLSLSLPLLIGLGFAPPMEALIEGDNCAYCIPSKLLANSRQGDVRPALSLVVFSGQPNACIWDRSGWSRGRKLRRAASELRLNG